MDIEDKATGQPAKTVPIFDDKAEVRGQIDLTDAQWRIAEGTNREDGEVEIAQVLHTDGVTYTIMRNSAYPEGPMLTFTPGEWKAFVEGVELGEFDEPW